MLYDVIDYDNQILGQVDARDSIEAWAKAKNEYGHILDVRLATASTDIEIKRSAGFMVRIGGVEVKSVMLPDWSLDFIEFPPGKMKEYRTALTQARMRITKVTDQRIYFEQ